MLAPIKNPAGKDRYDVLEICGFIYKGTYRMRFLYSASNGCLLMGQEVLELVNP